jgi:hypothetical protein
MVSSKKLRDLDYLLLEWTAAFREQVTCTEWGRYTTYVLLREAFVQRYRGNYYAPQRGEPRPFQ